MDFHAAEEQAQRTTLRLGLLFAVAVLAILGLVYGFCATFLMALHLEPGQRPRWWFPDLLVLLAVLHAVIVGLGTWLGFRELDEGGAGVALRLGGREVIQGGQTPRERVLCNVVEELAVASGLPVPRIFVLDNERSLNAFAAGLNPSDACVGVTGGGLSTWSRDELQAVMAHEFGHILHGDMRRNLQTMALLQGLDGVAEAGRVLMGLPARRSGRLLSPTANTDADDPVVVLHPALMLVGAGIYAIGWVGVLAGRLIRAAICRERELAADATAVRLTRNPGALASALKRMGGANRGTAIGHPAAEAASHLFVANALADRTLGELLDSHPRLSARIRKLDPGFHGAFHPFDVPAPEPRPKTPVRKAAPGPALPASGPDAPANSAAELPLGIGSDAAVPVELLAAAAIAATPGDTGHTVGGGPGAASMSRSRAAQQAALLRPGADGSLAVARETLSALPAVVREAAHDPAGAEALVLALCADADPAVRERQAGALETTVPPAVRDEVLRLSETVRTMPAWLRLPALELAMPALRGSGPSAQSRLRAWVDAMAAEVEEPATWQVVLRALLTRWLRPPEARQRSVEMLAVAPLAPDIAVLLAVLAGVGARDEDARRRAWTIGWGQLPPVLRDRPPLFPGPEQRGAAALTRALDRLGRTPPLVARRVLEACVHCALADTVLTVDEAELLRLVAEVLGEPTPGLLPSIGEAAG